MGEWSKVQTQEKENRTGEKEKRRKGEKEKRGKGEKGNGADGATGPTGPKKKGQKTQCPTSRADARAHPQSHTHMPHL